VRPADREPQVTVDLPGFVEGDTDDEEAHDVLHASQEGATNAIAVTVRKKRGMARAMGMKDGLSGGAVAFTSIMTMSGT
jgi:hypothetical protein